MVQTWLSDWRKTYSHTELCIIRKTSRCTIQTDTLQILKINRILRFRGTRAGRRRRRRRRRRNYRSKIPVHFSIRLDKAWWKGQPPVVFENRVLKPVVLRSTDLSSDNLLKFCSLNTRSLKSKTADSVAYMLLIAQPIFLLLQRHGSQIWMLPTGLKPLHLVSDY